MDEAVEGAEVLTEAVDLEVVEGSDGEVEEEASIDSKTSDLRSMLSVSILM